LEIDVELEVVLEPYESLCFGNVLLRESRRLWMREERAIKESGGSLVETDDAITETETVFWGGTNGYPAKRLATFED
jgi:hypothetical protein